jgi:hypothetical protein
MTGESMEVYVGWEREMIGILTTDHAASSYGIPVLLVNGVAYGPGEDEEFLILHPRNTALEGDIVPESVMMGHPVRAAHPLCQRWFDASLRTANG